MSGTVIERRQGLAREREEKNGEFGPVRQKAFLDALALTCNVRRAARHIGINPSSVYRRRRDDGAFAELWAQALSAGCDRLEVLVIEHGGAGEALDWPDPDRAAEDGEIPPFDLDRALKVLDRFRGKAGDRAVANPGHRRGESREETNALLLKALSAAKRRVERSPRGDK